VIDVAGGAHHDVAAGNAHVRRPITAVRR
jgi:hypothetical protein